MSKIWHVVIEKRSADRLDHQSGITLTVYPIDSVMCSWRANDRDGNAANTRTPGYRPRLYNDIYAAMDDADTWLKTYIVAQEARP